MRRAIFRAMGLSLLRDRAGLAMAFILPPIVFLIFAFIFAAASGGDLNVRLAVLDEIGTPQSKRLINRLLADDRFAKVPVPAASDGGSLADVTQRVRDGEADVGIVVRKDARALDDMSGSGQAPIALISDPARKIASSVVEGVLQDAFFAAIPEAAMRSVANQIDERLAPFSPEQRARVDQGLNQMGRATEQPSAAGDRLRMDRVYDTQTAVVTTEIPVAVTYYAGAVAIMFLLFSALTGALSLLEERESGLLDRLAVSPGGPGVVVDGKFLFLVLQGTVQAAVIFVVAWLGFNVSLPQNLAPWFVTSLAAAMAAAGLALAFVAACRTRQQAHTLGQMAIVILAAVGGSMVPRYLMPEEVQTLGWATPTTWAIEAYSGIFYRADTIDVLWPSWVVLASTGLAGLLIARMLVRRAV